MSSENKEDEPNFDDLVDEEYGNEFEEIRGRGIEKDDSSQQQDYTRKNKNKTDEKLPQLPKKEITVYKYSHRGKGDLHESVIVSGKPFFLRYDYQRDKIVLIDKIEEPTRILLPPSEEEYPYDPYEFKNINEINTVYLERVKKETNESLYKKIKTNVKKYNDRDKHSISLVSLDIFSSFFQDKFSTIHYDFVIGDNGTGKTAVGDTFESLGYRVVMMTDPTPANWFRVLGKIEWGQCTIIADEADRIDQSYETMNILKTGYQRKAKIPRMNFTNTKQDFFWTFGFKLILSESSPSLFTAKGVLDRSFIMNSYKGFPEYDIKEIRNPQGNPERQKLFDELNDLRKLLFIFRLVHFKDSLPEMKMPFDGRDKELTKPHLQLFYDSSDEVKTEIQTTLKYFIDNKNNKKENTIEAITYPIIVNLISQDGNSFYTSRLWHILPAYIEGRLDEKNPNIFHSDDYGTIYRNTLIKKISDKFGAEIKHKENGNMFVFNNELILRAGKIYDVNKKYGIQSKMLELDNISSNLVIKTDPPDPFDPSMDTTKTTIDNKLPENDQITKDIKHEIDKTVKDLGNISEK